MGLISDKCFYLAVFGFTKIFFQFFHAGHGVNVMASLYVDHHLSLNLQYITGKR